MTDLILIVEDEENLNKMIADYLSAMGFTCRSVFSGDKAIEVFHQINPSLVVLDLMLPKIDGMNVVRTIRKISDKPIIVLTARSDEPGKIAALDIGADDYMVKPFSLKELAARIRAVLRRYSGERSSDALSKASSEERVIHYRDLILDPDKILVFRDGIRIQLTFTQFQIAWKLLSSPGRVFSRIDLLQSFQEQAFEGYERTVDVHIKNIRKALGSPVYIETMYGAGYRAPDEEPST